MRRNDLAPTQPQLRRRISTHIEPIVRRDGLAPARDLSLGRGGPRRVCRGGHHGEAMTVAAEDLEFESHRPRLVGVAYRITGSRLDAEDVVQDAWLRWRAADRDRIEHPGAWLTTVTSRLALDRLKSAQHRREVYVGPWLPDPISEEPGPSAHAELAESLSIGFLAVLERLAPTERVVFLLADVFSVPFDEIATAVDKRPDACRQIASRARQRLSEGRPRFAPTDDEAWSVAAAFMQATEAGDVDTLVALLAEDALVVSDGGPDRHAARRPVIASRAPRFLINLSRREIQELDQVEVRLVNGQPGAVVSRDGRPWMALAVAVERGLVSRVWVVLNPDKLAGLDGRPVS